MRVHAALAGISIRWGERLTQIVAQLSKMQFKHKIPNTLLYALPDPQTRNASLRESLVTLVCKAWLPQTAIILPVVKAGCVNTSNETDSVRWVNAPIVEPVNQDKV